MKIFAQVKPNAAKNAVERLDETHFIVSTSAPATQNRANTAVIGLLSKYFDLPPSLLAIKRGQTSRQKTLEVQMGQRLFS